MHILYKHTPSIFNPYKPSIILVGHMQTVQTQSWNYNQMHAVHDFLFNISLSVCQSLKVDKSLMLRSIDLPTSNDWPPVSDILSNNFTLVIYLLLMTDLQPVIY